MKPVFFSVIVPTYNRAHLIKKTIFSVISQTYPHFEIIVVDDGSTDDTKIVVQSIPDHRVKYFWKNNEERGAARNFGVSKAKGDYVTFLDSDDLFYKNHLIEAAKLVEDKKPNVFHLAYEIRDTQNHLIASLDRRIGSLNEKILEGNSLSCMGVFLKQDIALRHPFNEARGLAGSEDWLLWLQLAARYSFEYSNKVTACMIQHEQRSVLNYDEIDLLQRTNLLLQALEDDLCFVQKFRQCAIVRIKAHMLTYIALHLSISHKKLSAVRYLLQASLTYPTEVFKRRTLAIIKHLICHVRN